MAKAYKLPDPQREALRLARVRDTSGEVALAQVYSDYLRSCVENDVTPRVTLARANTTLVEIVRVGNTLNERVISPRRAVGTAKGANELLNASIRAKGTVPPRALRHRGFGCTN
jgi:glucose-6-phosphate dehydrogenase assembly protein OpcA